jgi:hypothetical protein
MRRYNKQLYIRFLKNMNTRRFKSYNLRRIFDSIKTDLFRIPTNKNHGT